MGQTACMIVATLAAFIETDAHGVSSALARTGCIVDTTTPLIREVIIRGECRPGGISSSA